MSNEDLKLCKDCVHFRELLNSSRDYCDGKFNPRDPVNGSYWTEVRQARNRCGVDFPKFFIPKPEAKPKIPPEAKSKIPLWQRLWRRFLS